MLKLIFLLIGFVVFGFLITNEELNVTLTGFGYSVTTSLVLVFIALLLIVYVFYLLGKPFGWWDKYKNYASYSKMQKKEEFLTDVIKTVADQNLQNVPKILKQAKGLYPAGSPQCLLARALFMPKEDVFEELLKSKDTELAALRGLYIQAMEIGDLQKASNILEKAVKEYATASWVIQKSFDLQVLQNDWLNALVTLDTLKKNGWVTKQEYAKDRALILFQLKDLKGAYALSPENPAIAIAYARENPDKARDILAKSWSLEPCYDTYLAYRQEIITEPTAKRMKLVEKLISKNPGHKLSILALAQTALDAQLWGIAKEQLEIYLKSYPLTQQVALMMARAEKEGWNHEQEALNWEEKALTAEEKSTWFCKSCDHETNT
ncbi:MAG: hypothetical protein LBU87_00695, partial [Lactobacillales bacterium]|nr:hypothetical protein [Lactobacillales bacterium]